MKINITQEIRWDKNQEEKMTEDIEVLKLVKLILLKNIDNIEKYSDEINHMDMRNDKDSDERDQNK